MQAREMPVRELDGRGEDGERVVTAAEVEPQRPKAAMDGVFLGRQGLRAGWSLLVYGALLALLFFASTPLVRHWQMNAGPKDGEHVEFGVERLVHQEGLSLLTVVLATVAMSWIEKRPMVTYGIGRTRGAGRQFVTGLFWGVVLLSLLVGILWGTHRLAFDGQMLTGSAMVRFGLEWGLGFLLVGLFEEYFLRGYLQFTLGRGLTAIYDAMGQEKHAAAFGFWTAALVLSFLFGLAHLPNAGESPLGLLSASGAALVFCLSLWRTGSLWWAIGFHTAWDWSQSFLYGVADSGTLIKGHLLATHAVGNPLFSGGLTGPEGSVWVFGVLALACLVIRLTLGRGGSQREVQALRA